MVKNKADIKSILSRSHWIFDLDGTLTLPVHDFPAIRMELGIPDSQDILGFIGSLDKKDAQPILNKLNNIEIELAKRSQPADGVLVLMEQLSNLGIHIGIITRNTRDNARTTLKKIGILEYFSDDCILGREETHPKPDPDGIFKLLKYWDISPDNTIMIGDYLYDLQAGKSAGTATIHVDRNGHFLWSDLADIEVTSLRELHDHLH